MVRMLQVLFKGVCTALPLNTLPIYNTPLLHSGINNFQSSLSAKCCTGRNLDITAEILRVKSVCKLTLHTDRRTGFGADYLHPVANFCSEQPRQKLISWVQTNVIDGAAEWGGSPPERAQAREWRWWGMRVLGREDVLSGRDAPTPWGASGVSSGETKGLGSFNTCVL